MPELERHPARPQLAARRVPAAILIALSLAALLVTGSPRPVVAAPSATLVAVEAGFSNPVLVTNAGDGSGRLFVVEQGGRIKVIKNGNTLATPFLNISGKLSLGGERGLLGLAFHPSYETNRKLYVYFTRGDGDVVVEEYRADPGNPDRALASSARRILTHQPSARQSQRRPSGIRAGRLPVHRHGRWRRLGRPEQQRPATDTLLGKLLRIDINGTSGSQGLPHPIVEPARRQAGPERDLVVGPAEPVALLVRPRDRRPVDR